MSAGTQWEYTTADRTEQLNALGAAGWELVSVTVVGGAERFYLKRALPSLREQITLEQRKQALSTAEGGAGE